MKRASVLLKLLSGSVLGVLVPISQAWLPPSSLSGLDRRTFRCFSFDFHGRGIPYVETYEEQTTRRLWESVPFSTTKSVVDRVLRDDISRSKALLVKLESENRVSKITGYEYLFDSLYKSQPIETPYGYLREKNHLSNDNRSHFLLQVAYRGSDFCGWQTQPHNEHLPSVQQSLEEWLQSLEGRKVNVRVCGRTDAGVNAIGQIARFRSHHEGLLPHQVKDHLSQIPLKNTGLKCLDVLPVTKSFHPTFGTKSRAYVYLVDVEQWRGVDTSKVVTLLHTQLQSVQGVALDYIALSYGRLKTQTSICTLHHAQAHLVEEAETGRLTICIELVGDRFLRRMVRMLVANIMRIAVRRLAAPHDALLEHVESRDRGRSGKPAPPDGLIFVGATFQ